MRKYLSLAVILLFAIMANGQVTGVKPNEFTEETNPNTANFEFYSQKNDSIRRASFLNVQKNMAPQVTWSAINFVPDSTGNVSNLVQFVVTAGDSIFYIDGYGDAILLYDPADTTLSGSLTNDTLTIRNLLFDLRDYKQTIDTSFILADTLYLSLSDDGEPAKTIDLSAYAGDTGITASGPMFAITGDSIYWASDTLTTDILMRTNTSTSGRFRIMPLSSTKAMAFIADHTTLQLYTSLNSLIVKDTSIIVTLADSGSNISEFKVTDTRRNQEGIIYGDNYSSGFVARSLVDKEYTDNKAMLDSVAVEVDTLATATMFNILPVNTTSAAVTINPPASPSIGEWFAVSDSRGNATTFNITVDFTGATQNFHGSSQDFVLDADFEFARFTYVNATVGWIISN